MADPLTTIKAAVRDLRPYSLDAKRALIKLNQNENAWDVPGEIREETFRRIADRAWSRYPDFIPLSLHERLAEFVGWKPDGVIAGNGSNELIQALLMVTMGDHKRLLICEPTFALHRQLGTVLGGEVLSVSLSPSLLYDIDALAMAIKAKKPEVTIICSPNNPTGCVVEKADLISLLRLSDGLIVVDEAYFEFSGQSVVPLLAEYPNLVVLHTFSKAMALAGLRVGYLLASPELAREISKAVLPYNLNLISQAAAEVSIQMYESKLRPLIRNIIAERDRLYLELSTIDGLTPIRSRANFMVVRCAIDPRPIFTELFRRDILIRDVSSYPMLRDYFRVSVGKPEENELLLQALREILGSEGR